MSIETIQEPITGKETPTGEVTPYSSLVQFYNAFNSADISLMTKNWSQTEDIAMNNPLGGIKRGWDEIEAVYQALFTGEADVYVEFYDYTIHESALLFYAVGRERGTFTKGDVTVDLAIRTSRIFRWVEEEWLQIHHHGSIDDPDLLHNYQQAVSK